jgi:adenine-specific DNA-methyltransferase
MPKDFDLSGIRLAKGDSFRLIERVPDNSVQLTVSSPPYNIGKAYEKKTDLDQYLNQFRDLIEHLYRVTNDHGSVCWQVGNFIDKGSLVPLDIPFFYLFQEAGFQLKNRIIWHFRHGLHARSRFSGRYETIMWFSKGANPVFNLDEVRIPALYPGKRAFKGPRKGLPTGHPGGKNPSDFWPDVLLEDWESAIWDLPNVKANHPEKTSHPCQFPVELVERCILALSAPDDLVLDPFLGVGSTAIAAQRHERRFLGFELDADYLDAAKKRLALAKKGQLPTRKMGTPIATPRGRVAEVPVEWRQDR